MKRFLPILLAVALLCGCASQAVPAQPAAEPSASTEPPTDPAHAKPGEATCLTTDLISTIPANTDAVTQNVAPAADFAFSLFGRALSAGEKNPVLSPLSAYLCLAMVQNGAHSKTLAAFEKMLGADTDSLNRLCHALTKQLLDTAGSTKLAIANSAWADAGKAVLEKQYLQDITDWFGAEVYSADLPSEEALKAINAWVNDKTNGLIPVLHDTPYPDSTVLVLLNTLYLKAAWQDEFMGWQTFDESFTLTGGSIVTVPFMHHHAVERNCIVTPDAEGIVLPYDDGKTAFVALKPTTGDAHAFAASLTAASFSGYLAAAENTLVDLSLPKFTIEYSLSLNDALSQMGLAEAFDPAQADFSRMGTSTDGALYLSQVFQKVKIEVNEKGTEAAAVTEAALAGAAFMPEKPLDLRFDSPFVYAVVDLASGLPLFIGLMDTPAV